MQSNHKNLDLNAAIQTRSLHLVKEALAAGAQVTPESLDLAIKTSVVVIVKDIIAAGAQVTPESLDLAIKTSMVVIVKDIIAAGAQVTPESLDLAIKTSMVVIVKDIIAAGAQVTPNTLDLARKAPGRFILDAVTAALLPLPPEMHVRNTSSNEIFNKFLNYVNETPDKTAVCYKNIKMSYKELENKINQIAVALKNQYSHLFKYPQKHPISIGVMCHSKLDALCCEFAILSLGATFVPFDFNTGMTRQSFMIQKSKISLMLTDVDTIEFINSVHNCYIPSLLKNKNIESDQTVYKNEVANALAYILFTSGSTADNPKGVMRSQKSLLAQMTRDYKDDLKITNKDCLLNLAILSHDQAVVDCFAALLNGCTLCLYDPKDMNVNDLHNFMIHNQVTIFSSIPSMFTTIFENVKDKLTFPHLRVVTIGGEETLISHALLFQKSCPELCVLINGYGATEMSWIAFYTINHQTNVAELKNFPLGYLTKSAKFKLMPYNDNESADNNANTEKLFELCIASDSLSSGYLDDAVATAKSFFLGEDKNIYYKTGDIVNLDDNQCIHYLGRASGYEKINGKRIDTREIENALLLYFKKCAVIAHGQAERKKLYAFCVTPIKNVDLKTIKIKLSKILEKHMIPHFKCLNVMPVLANGKIDRLSLRKTLKNDEDEFNADIAKIKRYQEYQRVDYMIEGCWREILEIPFSILLNQTDTFRELGGDSQSAIRLSNLINKYFKKNLDIPISIEILVVDIQDETFPSLCEYANKFYDNVEENPRQVLMPSVNIKTVLLPEQLERSTGYYINEIHKANDTDNDKTWVRAYEYNYIGLEIITNYTRSESFLGVAELPPHKG